MLAWLKRYSWLLLLAALWIGMECWFSWLATCQPIYRGEAGNQYYQEHCTAFGGPVISILRFSLSRIDGFLKFYEHEIVAAFTIVLAGSTIGLWLSTKHLWTATKEAVDLANKEFIATHRPRIIVYGIQAMKMTEATDEELPVQFRYINSGDSEAYIVAIGTNLVYSRRTRQVRGDVTFNDERFEPPILVKGGEHGFKLTAETIDPITLITSDVDGGGVFCIGYISYRDANGAIRQTGFCRRYDTEAKRWLKVDDDDYEYAY